MRPHPSCVRPEDKLYISGTVRAGASSPSIAFPSTQYTQSAKLSYCFLTSFLTVAFFTMSTVRRSKAMPTDGPTAKFLYTIIKQLDLKSVCQTEHEELTTSLTTAIDRLESRGIPVRDLKWPCCSHAILALPTANGRHHLHSAVFSPQKDPRQSQNRRVQGRRGERIRSSSVSVHGEARAANGTPRTEALPQD